MADTMDVMDQNLREEVVRDVVRVLMETVKSDHKDDQSVIVAIRQNDGHRAAIYTIVKRMGLSQATVDWVINQHIEKYQKSLGHGRFEEDTDLLSDASTMICLGASKEVIETVVGILAEKGWYGRTESLCRELLCRNLTPKEINALVDEYVNNLGSRSTTQEEYLIDLAERCLDSKGARAVRTKINMFIREWDSHID